MKAALLGEELRLTMRLWHSLPKYCEIHKGVAGETGRGGYLEEPKWGLTSLQGVLQLSLLLGPATLCPVELAFLGRTI